MSIARIQRVQGHLFPVNAYLVELQDGVVVVDALLGVSDGRSLRANVDALDKPFLGVLITHAHPDHYGGLTSLLDGTDVPVFATEGVRDVIRRDDASKEEILRPMFGDEWAHERTFPSRIVRDGERITFGGTSFRVIDLGPGESPHDSLWTIDAGSPSVFVGDLVYNEMHAYLADGFHDSWLENIERASREFPPDALFYMGHGIPSPAAGVLRKQQAYIRTFLDAVRTAAEDAALDDEGLTAVVTDRMRAHLPVDDLLFLMQLSIIPTRDQLAFGNAL
jgi:glyoxylase-like metal-dependent hydrolase (beta-lactamase superfamily II)